MSVSSSTPSKQLSDGRISPVRKNSRRDKTCSDDDGKDEVDVRPHSRKITPRLRKLSSERHRKLRRMRFRSSSSDSRKSEVDLYNGSSSDYNDNDNDDNDDDDDDDDNDDNDSIIDDENDSKTVNSTTENSETKATELQDGKFELLRSNSCEDEDDDGDDDNNNNTATANTSRTTNRTGPRNTNTKNYRHSYSTSNLSCYSQESGDYLTDNDYYSNPETLDSASGSSNTMETRSTSSGSSVTTASSNTSLSTGSTQSSSDKHTDPCAKNVYHLKKLVRRLMSPSFVTVYGFCVIIVSIALTLFTCLLLSSTMSSRAKKQAITSYTELSWHHRDVVVRRIIQAESFAVAQAGIPGLFNSSVYDTPKTVALLVTFLNSFDAGYSFSVSRANGNFYGAYFDGATLCTNVVAPETQNRLCTYHDDEYLTPCANPEEHNVFEKSWYVAVGNATNASDGRWLGFLAGPKPLYVYAAPAVEGGRNIGVSTISLLYESIGTDILSYPETSGAEKTDMIFGIDLASGDFLGSSGHDRNIPCVRDDGTTKRKSLPVTEVDDPDILDAANALYEHWGESWNGSSVGDATIITKYGRTVSAAIVERAGLRWAIVMIGFRDYNDSVIDDAVGPGIMFFVFFVAIVAVGISIKLISPITTLSHDMAVVSKLRFADVAGRRGFSWVKEIRTTQESFRRVAVGIEALSKYAPTAVLRDVMRSGTRVSPHLENASPVAIMFVDIVGLSAIIDTLTAKNQAVFSRVLTRWFKEFCTIIQNTRGMIDKFIGGGIIALYGVPHRIKGPELAAARAAVEFRAAIKRVNKYGEHLAKKHGVKIPTLTYRVGIHSGAVKAGHLGYSEHLNYTALGAEVIVASRMEQLGKKFHVTPLVTGTVARRISSEYLCVFLNLIPYPGGGGEYVRVYHLVGRKKEVPKKYVVIAEVFRKIHVAVHEDDKHRALSIIKSALGSDRFKMYSKALKCLQQSILDGGITKAVYSNETSYYSTSNSNSSYSQVSSKDDTF